ncbi:MAG TPA: alpha/beta hydrolase-fold protein [Cellvibrionaceae bacterium]
MKIKFVLLVIVCMSTLQACGRQGGDYAKFATDNTIVNHSDSPVAAYPYVGSVQTNLSITSKITGITYPYHVYLPYNYSLSAKSYSVIYGTDAQWVFPHFSQRLDVRNKDVIFVGIEEGPLNSNRRFDDFLGSGVSNYMSFFKTEFVPMIESTYRTNHERTYVGTSLGGLLGSSFLAKEPLGEPYFKNYLLFDGSFFALTEKDIQAEEERFNASKKLDVTLILTSASPGNVNDVTVYEQRYESRQYEDFTIHRLRYLVPHNDVANPSFDEAIEFIY